MPVQDMRGTIRPWRSRNCIAPGARGWRFRKKAIYVAVVELKNIKERGFYKLGIDLCPVREPVLEKERGEFNRLGVDSCPVREHSYYYM